ncbi:C-type lectin BML-2-like [Haliotis rubra]|uniref:C-type lectin BML-2-like n=1 Tax=Haliotis rubra TaxID=36100 RepID=UPI001EE5BE66|nr:C-type lectin BML-2-like [Haliotis rubra]
MSFTVALGAFLVLASVTLVTEGVCPNGWTKYDDSCYSVFTNKNSWHEAQQFCTEFGSHLATLDTKAKNTNARDFLHYLRVNESVWIGVNDRHKEGAWIWDSNQKPVTYTAWASGEPNQSDGHQEDCVIMYSSRSFKWADLACSNKRLYLCERPSVPEH